jgi:hypothetical protein
MDDDKIAHGKGGGGRITPAKRGNKLGRKPGVPNGTTQMLKDAILLAAECMGMPEVVRNDKGEIIDLIETGEDGLLGYLRYLCKTDVKSFVYLLGRVLPLQVHGRIEAEVRNYRSIDEIIAEMREEGLHDELLPPAFRLVKPDE